jgi:hypothetical protein
VVKNLHSTFIPDPRKDLKLFTDFKLRADEFSLISCRLLCSPILVAGPNRYD